ncbi:MAG: NADH-quinone oxidoreductase subunit C [Acidobacteria bacterium]|nr:NADH-quinone oxidoreductase subunit C [Acidobacteriota bacterium]MCA1642173.1 NADH-quinone oxidoreductase subunit C [Acidobacteriota bacterium]
MSQDIQREQQIAEQAAVPAASQESPLVAALRQAHPEWVTGVVEAFGETTIVLPRGAIVGACAFFKTTEGLEFNLLSDICGVDRGQEEDPRFEVNYQLFSTTKHHRLRLKVLLAEDDARVPTVTNVWRTANWHERETFDLFGVRFEGHPDLRRILLPDDWQGHALRKDFPLRGYEPYSLT